MPRVLLILFGLLAACTSHEAARRPASAASEPAGPGAWTRVTTLAALESALRAASESRPIMLDFHAAWCMPCMELEQRTLVDPAVAPELARFTTIQIDVTDDPAGELQALFAAETLPNLQIYAAGSGLGRALADRRPGATLPQPIHRVTRFVAPEELTPLLAAVR